MSCLWTTSHASILHWDAEIFNNYMTWSWHCMKKNKIKGRKKKETRKRKLDIERWWWCLVKGTFFMCLISIVWICCGSSLNEMFGWMNETTIKGDLCINRYNYLKVASGDDRNWYNYWCSHELFFEKFYVGLEEFRSKIHWTGV